MKIKSIYDDQSIGSSDYLSGTEIDDESSDEDWQSVYESIIELKVAVFSLKEKIHSSLISEDYSVEKGDPEEMGIEDDLDMDDLFEFGDLDEKPDYFDIDAYIDDDDDEVEDVESYYKSNSVGKGEYYTKGNGGYYFYRYR